MKDKPAHRSVILAAGAARRLAPCIGDLNKCLADVGGRPIIDYQLAPLADAGVADVTVVVGYRADLLRRDLVARYPALRFRFVDNPDYASTNTIWSLCLARESLAGGAFLCNGDIVIDPQVIERLAAADPATSWLAVTRADCADEEVKALVDDAGRIIRIGKQLDPARCAGEFIGAARFSPACGTRYAKELELVAPSHRHEYFEFALDRILADQDVRLLDVTDLPCIEIDFPEDLDRARRDIAPAIARRGRDGRMTGGDERIKCRRQGTEKRRARPQ